MEVLVGAPNVSGGNLQRAAAGCAARRQRPRPQGQSSDAVFPAPLVFASGLPPRGRARERAMRRRKVLGVANTFITACNLQFVGTSEASCTSLAPTAAQRRAQQRAFVIVNSFLGDTACVSGEHAIREFLRLPEDYVGHGRLALPLGLRAGVPDRASAVSLAEEVRFFDAKMASQIEHPTELLLSPSTRPTTISRPFVKLVSTYPDYVKRNVRAGLQRLRARHRIFKHRGVPAINGTFAVAKNSAEDRAISALCPTNDLIDASKLWRPKFARVSVFRTLVVRPGMRLRLYKRDARHYYHMLRVGRRWRKLLAHPPVPATSSFEKRYPVHIACPMGFTGSAAWAQGLNEALSLRGGLPQGRRMVDGTVPPGRPPVWGSILDDIWAVDEVPGADAEDAPHVDAAVWVEEISKQWTRVGTTRTCRSASTASSTARSRVPASRPKRLKIIESGLWLVSEHRVMIERWVGKLSFAQSFRVCTRSGLESIYTWMDRYRRAGVRRARLWPAVVNEMLLAMLEEMTMEIDMKAQWCPRVESSDASPGGHGRAWTMVAIDTDSEISRIVAEKGCYINLNLEYGVALDEAGRCALQQIDLHDYNYVWSSASRPGGLRHITLEEGSAAVWSLHDRLRRPTEGDCRCVHLLDSAALCGALRKGRSPSRRLNAICRQAKVPILLGGLEPFFPWVGMDRNPSDEASSKFGIRASTSRSSASSRSSAPLPASASTPLSSASSPSPSSCASAIPRATPMGVWWAKEHPLPQHLVQDDLATHNVDYDKGLPMVALHLCSGPLRPGSYAEHLLDYFAKEGFSLVIISVDPAIHPSLDLTDPLFISNIEELVRTKRVVSAMASAVLNVVSCAACAAARRRRAATASSAR